MLEPIGVADRAHPFADAQAIGVAEGEGRQAQRADLEEGEVGGRIGADERGRELALVGEADADPVGRSDDVVVGEDEALGIHDEARALSAARTLAVGVVERARAAVPGGLGDGDVDDGRVDPLDDVGEVGRPDRGGGRGMDGVHDTAPPGQHSQKPRHTSHQSEGENEDRARHRARV